MEDACPRHLCISEQDLKLIRKYRMCKFFGHHTKCPWEEYNGCDFSHDTLIREAYDKIKANKEKGVDMVINEIRAILMKNSNENSHEQRTIMNGKCETLLNYPTKPI